MPSKGWQRDASGLTRALEPIEWALSRRVSALRITPSNGAPAAKLVLARETWMPISLECRRPFGLEMWRFARGGIVQELPGDSSPA